MHLKVYYGGIKYSYDSYHNLQFNKAEERTQPYPTIPYMHLHHW